MPFYQHFIWHSIWNIFWHSVYFHIFGYSIQRICRHSFWHGFWHYSWHPVCHRFWFFLEYLLTKIKGPDNPTCQLRPTSSKRKVKMAWGKQEREKRWWRIGVEQVVCGRVRTSKLCMEKLCCMHVCVYVCMDVCMDVWMYGCMDGCMDVWMDGCMDANIYIYIWCQMATDDAGTTISSAPNMQQRYMPSRCHQIPRMPRETKMNVSKCHACHANSRGDHSGTWEPSAPPELAQCHTCHACHAKWVSRVPRLPRETKVDVTKCHACHVKRRWMSPSATPATQKAAATTRARGNRARHQS